MVKRICIISQISIITAVPGNPDANPPVLDMAAISSNMAAEQPMRGMELQEKEAQKD